jgi:type IV pilus assembly protein PilV
MRARHRNGQAGTSMLEVLITIVILAIGLLGLAGLQTRLQLSEMEGYQRTQAMILLDDMANRLSTNRSEASSYVTGNTAANTLGAGMTCPSADTTRHDKDVRQWCLALQGASEKTGTSSTAPSVGAMVGGRGCIESLNDNQYLITVAWQGLGAIAAPPTSVQCGKNQYNGTAGTTCSNDLCRRAVTTIIRIAPLA